MVKVILRSLVFLNPTQVQLIRGDPKYKLMSPEEVIGKFVSFELMIKGSKQIIEQGTTSTLEVQPVAFKATEEKKEESTSSRLPIDASKFDKNKKHVKVKNAYAQEVEKCEKLTSELSTCHDVISNLRNENAKLIAKVEKLDICDDSIVSLRNDNDNFITKIDKLNASLSSLKIENEKLIAKAKKLNVCKPSTSTIEHVTICTRCRDINIDAIHDHLALIKQQNEKFKFARSMLYSGRRPGIKDGIGFQKGDNVKHNAPKKLSNFVKGKAPIVQDNEGYILYPVGYPEHKIRRIHSRKSHSRSHHAFMYKSEASSSRQSTHVKFPKKKSPIASNEPNISFKTFDASYVLTNKSGKVVVKYVGAKHKGSKTCVWVPKVLVSNVKGPKTVWVPKNKA
jgi:hypothetical protein